MTGMTYMIKYDEQRNTQMFVVGVLHTATQFMTYNPIHIKHYQLVIKVKRHGKVAHSSKWRGELNSRQQ